MSMKMPEAGNERFVVAYIAERRESRSVGHR